MDPADAAAKITARTKAVLPVHYAGIPAEMDDICALARSHDLLVIEDAAHAPAARFSKRACGSFGAAGCFSFFGNKNITTAEGGMITTNDPEFASRLRLLRSHGMTVTSWDREKGRPSHYDVLEIGFNLRFDDVRAALGLAQIEKLEEINRRRSRLARRYSRLFTESKLDLVLPFAAIDERKEPSYHIYPVVFPSSADRDSMEESLRAEGIQTSIHYPPIHQFSAFRQMDSSIRLPLTEAFASRELTLPLYPSLSEDQVDRIVSSVVHCYAAARRG